MVETTKIVVTLTYEFLTRYDMNEEAWVHKLCEIRSLTTKGGHHEKKTNNKKI